MSTGIFFIEILIYISVVRYEDAQRNQSKLSTDKRQLPDAI
jgi:hypothetical protein